MRVEFDRSVGSYLISRLSLRDALCLKETVGAVANLRDKFPEDDNVRLAGHPDINVGNFFTFLTELKEKLETVLIRE